MTTHRAARRTTNKANATSKRRICLAVATVTLLAVVGAACGDDSSAGGGTIDAISVTSPVDGATVDGSFDVEVDTGPPIGEPDTGRQHLHIYYDVEPGAEDYDIVYDLPFTTRELPPGEHTVEVVVANGDHSITDVRHELTVTVESETGAGDAPSPSTRESDSSGSDSEPGY